MNCMAAVGYLLIRVIAFGFQQSIDNYGSHPFG